MRIENKMSGQSKMKNLIKDIFYAGLGLYIIVYFLVHAVATATADENLSDFAPLISLVIVVAVISLVWILFGNALSDK